MPIDPGKQRKIIVVHGVQTGDDAELHQDDAIRQLLESRLGDIDVDYEVVLYKYENINNQALNKYQNLSKLIFSNPVASALAPAVIDIVGDVVISLAQGSTAEKIRQGLLEKIISYYEQGHPCYLVAHSLGTVYTFDVVNLLMRNSDYFDRDNRLTWPVLGWLTIGSPLGLDMFKVTGRNRLTDLGPGDGKFPWRNYYDPNDPVVSGSVFGSALGNVKVAESYIDNTDAQGWWAEDYSINTGKLHLLAHTAYWDVPVVGEGIRSMVVE